MRSQKRLQRRPTQEEETIFESRTSHSIVGKTPMGGRKGKEDRERRERRQSLLPKEKENPVSLTLKRDERG